MNVLQRLKRLEEAVKRLEPVAGDGISISEGDAASGTIIELDEDFIAQTIAENGNNSYSGPFNVTADADNPNLLHVTGGSVFVNRDGFTMPDSTITLPEPHSYTIWLALRPDQPDAAGVIAGATLEVTVAPWSDNRSCAIPIAEVSSLSDVTGTRTVTILNRPASGSGWSPVFRWYGLFAGSSDAFLATILALEEE